jgi:hypothetical protein
MNTFIFFGFFSRGSSLILFRTPPLSQIKHFVITTPPPQKKKLQGERKICAFNARVPFRETYFTKTYIIKTAILCCCCHSCFKQSTILGFSGDFAYHSSFKPHSGFF